MKNYLICTFLLIASDCISQLKPLAVTEHPQKPNPKEEIPLFDANEIQQRKIDTAFVIYHPGSWAEFDPKFNPCTCPYNDTLVLYCFDNDGRIKERTTYYAGRKSTTYYDSIGRIRGLDYSSDTSMYKENILIRHSGSDSIVTTISFWKFKHGMDTASIQINRYNKKGTLIETESKVNKRNEREVDDDTGLMTYHYKYQYDDEDRLIYYQNLFGKEYEKITYPPFGRIVEVYNSQTKKLVSRSVRLVNVDKGIMTISTEHNQITLVPLETGSKLYKLISNAEAGKITLLYFHEIVYK